MDTTTREYKPGSGGMRPPRAAEWPRHGAHVRLIRWTEGNTYRGDQALPDLWVEGFVTETPAAGSSYLSITPTASSRPLGGGPLGFEYDPQRAAAWTVSPNRVSIRGSERSQWTIREAPAPEPAADEVADVVHLTASGAQVARLRAVLAELADERASDQRTGVEQAALVDELRRLAAALVAEA